MSTERSNETDDLRALAEHRLVTTRRDVQSMPIDDAGRLVHELQVHQIELELQNEELRRAQVELEASRDAYLDLYDFAPVGYLTLDPMGVIREANLTAATLLGVERRRLAGRKLAHFAVRADQDTVLRHCREVLSTGARQTCEIRIRTAKGAALYVRLETVAVEDDKAQRNTCRMVVADITERRQAEKELERHREHLEELVQERTALLDAINKVFQEALKCESAEEVARTYLAVAGELTGSKFGIICELNQAGGLDTVTISSPEWDACRIPKTDAGLMLDDLEIRGICGTVVEDGRSLMSNDPASHPSWAGVPEGHPAITCFLGVPLEQAGRTIGMIGLANKESGYDLADQKAIEVTAVSFVEALKRKRAEKALERLNRELDRKNRELESVLYAASHDLWSPLVNIKGFSSELDQACKAVPSLVADAQLPNDQKEQLSAILEDVVPRALEFIVASVTKMDALLDGLLRLSRVGQAAVQTEELDVNAMLADIVKAFEFQVRESGATLQIDTLPPCLGDATQINQVFSNLLGNALKYLDSARSGVIHVHGHQQEGRAVYCVEDNGIGIAPEHHDKVFEVFCRLNPESNVAGEGLGLATVHRILDRHQGKVWLESEPGKGSRFFVSLKAQAR